MEVIERIAEHYDVQEMPYGRAYHWAPKSILVECDCGERLTLSGSVTTCPWCGADWAGMVREKEVVGHHLSRDEVRHPWRYWHSAENEGVPV
jgi:hypothetical protein